MTQQLTLPLGLSGPRSSHSNGIWIGSTFSAQLTVVSNRQTHTDHATFLTTGRLVCIAMRPNNGSIVTVYRVAYFHTKHSLTFGSNIHRQMALKYYIVNSTVVNTIRMMLSVVQFHFHHLKKQGYGYIIH